ncbi:MAG: hypothetical protein KAH68_06960 [Draconibacterium sp.]|nr:hypothetical protein [Draconibacterium sp.]
MKLLKKYFLTLLILSTVFNSCNKEDDFIQKPLLTKSLKTFKNAFPTEFNLLNWNSYKENINLSKVDNKIPDITFNLIESIDGNSYYVEFEGKGFYILYSKINKEINIFKVNDPSKYVIMPYDEITLVPDLNSELQMITLKSNLEENYWRYSLCIAGCTGVAVAIAATDGPAPLMDIVAIAFQIDCSLGCVDTWLE